MAKVLITAHRGMGVTAKRRDLFIEGAEFFPENSMAAFHKAIELNADALECDIHVSHDNVAMIIHGDKARDYCYEVDVVNKSISVPSDKKRISSLSSDILLSRFRLKTLTDIEKQLITLNQEKEISRKAGHVDHISMLSTEINELWRQYTRLKPEFTKIPTLEELLCICADENERRIDLGIPSLKLNLELKGPGSGYITLATIAHYNKKAWSSNGALCEINPADIILLGRTSVGEIITAKSLLMGARKFLDETDDLSQKEYNKIKGDLLRPLMGTKEQAKIYGKGYSASKEQEKKIPQELTPSKIARKIIDKYAQDNHIKKGAPEINILRSFLIDVSVLSAIRTNVMISTGDLYGKDAILSDDEDFDLRDGIHEISPEGKKIILECMVDNHYDGIDISLFDFEMETCNALIPAIEKLKHEGRNPISGATASNWKGVKHECSPITPAEAVLKAHYIAQTLDVDIILKVDEPGFFKELYQNILDEKFTRTEKSETLDIIDMKDMDINAFAFEQYIVPEQSEIIDVIKIKGLHHNRFSNFANMNYDVDVPTSIDFLSNSPKPPRGLCKRNSDEFSPIASPFSLSEALASSTQMVEECSPPNIVRRISLSESFEELPQPTISLTRTSFSTPPNEDESFSNSFKNNGGLLSFSYGRQCLKELEKLVDESDWNDRKRLEDENAESSDNDVELRFEVETVEPKKQTVAKKDNKSIFSFFK